jgi:hypothetical protein
MEGFIVGKDTSAVIAGLDPAICLLGKKTDARVKPMHDM